MNRYTSGPAATISRRANTVAAETSVEKQLQLEKLKARRNKETLNKTKPSLRRT
jgi:hypothetical protein